MTWPRSWECVEKPYWQSRIASILRRLASLMTSPALCSRQSMIYSSSKNDQKRCPALQRIQSIQNRSYLSDCNMVVPPKAPAPRNAHNRSGDALSHRMGKKYKGFEALSPENPRLQIRNKPAKRVRTPSRPPATFREALKGNATADVLPSQ